MSLTNKISEFLEKLDNKQRYYIFGGILLGVFLLDYLVLMRPQLSALSKITPEIKLSSDELKNARENIQKIDYFKGQVADYEAKIEEANKTIKNKSELPLILEKVSLIADSNSIKIDQIMPSSTEQTEILKVKGRTYFALPVKIQARSTYHDFGRFLNALEYGDVSLDVNAFAVTGTADPQSHSIDLTLDVIVYEGT